MGRDILGPNPDLLGFVTVNAKDFGAVGDGVINDTSAIQAALNSVKTTGGAVLIPRGTYRINATLKCDGDNLFIFGEGMATKLVMDAGTNDHVLWINSLADTATNGVNWQNRFKLADLYIDNNGANQSGTGNAIYCSMVSRVRINNVYVKNAKNVGFNIRGCIDVRMHSCTVDGVYWGGAANGYNLGQTGQVPGQDYTMESCYALGVSDVAIWVAGSGGHRFTIQGCQVRSDATKYLVDGAVTSGTGTFTSATAGFTAADAGKPISIAGAGPAGAALTTRIFSVTNATTIALNANASTTVSGAAFNYGNDGAPARYVIDGAITSGQATVTSATANFTSADVGKTILIRNAVAANSDLKANINSVTNATTAVVSVTATATVSNAVVIINPTATGIVSEGAVGNSDHISLIGNHVIGCVQTGIGATDANGGLVGSKHDYVTIVGNTVEDNYGIAGINVTGTNFTIGNNTVKNYHSTGIWVGGNNFDEAGWTITGNTITGASDAVGNSIKLQKPSANPIRNISISGNRLDGGKSTLGGSGILANGFTKALTITGNTIANHGGAGIILIAASGVSPIDTIIIGNDIRNNNQASNGSASLQAGIACESAADSVTIIGNRCTDDQGTKTQAIGLHWLSATRGRIKDNDFRGNGTAAVSAAFDANTVYANNIDAEAAFSGTATLVAGTVTVSTAGVRNSGFNNSLVTLQTVTAGGTPGAKYVSAINSGVSFTITSTSGTDTSTVAWRIT